MINILEMTRIIVLMLFFCFLGITLYIRHFKLKIKQLEESEDYYQKMFFRAVRSDLRIGDKIKIPPIIEISRDGTEIVIVEEKTIIINQYNIKKLLISHMKYKKL